MKCILCRMHAADSAEHIFKSSIYQKVTGDGKSWLIIGDSTRTVNGRGSKKLKPIKNLCSKCNNEISKKPDDAISLIHEHLWKTERVAGNIIPLSKLEKRFGAENLVQLKRYFAKHLACLIHRYKYTVPDVLGDIFTNSAPLEKLSLSIRVDSTSLGEAQGVPCNPEEITPIDYMYNLPLGAPGDPAKIKAGAIPSFYSTAIIASDIRYDLKIECH